MRASPTAFVLCGISALAACITGRNPRPDATHQREPAPSEHADVSASAHEPDRISLEGWPAETFPLPPGFAPGLPTGTESLLFAPGWRDPTAESFWSYAFVMRIEESAPDAERIDELLETYYDGLMSSFAAGVGKDISGTPVRVVVVRTAPNHFEVEMHLIDAFATFRPIELRIVVESVAETEKRSTVRVQVSPQPKAHVIWRSLAAAIASLS